MKVELRVVGGDVIEQSVVEYFQGAGTMLPGLEHAVEGLEPGGRKEGVIAADQAFGNPASQPSKAIPRAEFPKDASLEPGAEFAAKSDNGQDVVLVVEKVDDEAVHVRLAHPLARKDISFQVEILTVTDPTPPPLPGAALLEETD
jgi:FKBP-type peptidyl-prolyl cis-trans isomerase SlyD